MMYCLASSNRVLRKWKEKNQRWLHFVFHFECTCLLGDWNALMLPAIFGGRLLACTGRSGFRRGDRVDRESSEPSKAWVSMLEGMRDSMFQWSGFSERSGRAVSMLFEQVSFECLFWVLRRYRWHSGCIFCSAEAKCFVVNVFLGLPACLKFERLRTRIGPLSQRQFLLLKWWYWSFRMYCSRPFCSESAKLLIEKTSNSTWVVYCWMIILNSVNCTMVARRKSLTSSNV